MKTENGKNYRLIFSATLLLVIILFFASAIKTRDYNLTLHDKTFTGSSLFTGENNQNNDLSVNAVARSSTWTKVFDLYDEGLTEANYQAYTYDFNISNNTKDEVDGFTFKLIFNTDIYLASAWNGALEIHQNVNGKELVSTVPDMREFKASEHDLETVTFDGEDFINMKAGDYFIYIPSSSMNAMEVPIEPYEGTTPGFILYTRIGESIEESSLELQYKFNRLLTSEPLFWVSIVGLGIWAIALIIYEITSAQIRKYNSRHERDNEIINESIETFTGFIDAKDPYTNGHSKRVADYTRLIAKQMGYKGEDLDRIYYIALLHDCGKIGVPDNILGKPGKLTDEEFEIIKSHTVNGGEILHALKSLEHVEDGARFHHERFDGKGYPEGRAGEDIPLIGRMICVADSFDAMNTNRVYRNRLTKERIIDEIESNKGRQFDPKIADIMLDLIRNGEITVGE